MTLSTALANLKIAAVLAPSLGIISGCSGTVIQDRPIPEELLVCEDEPVPGEIQTNRELVVFIERLRLAGKSCRDALDIIYEYEYGADG